MKFQTSLITLVTATVALFAYSAYSYAVMPLVLIPDHPLSIKLKLYDDPEILLLPVSNLQADTSYLIRESHRGADSFSVSIKRKQLEANDDIDNDQSFDPSKFRKKYAHSMGFKTQDYKDPSQFRLNDELAYQDDPTGSLYEIWHKPLSSEKLLAFEMTAFRTSRAADNASAFEEVEFSLELLTSGWNSVSRVENPAHAIPFTVFGIILFISIVVPALLESQKGRVQVFFGLFTVPKNQKQLQAEELEGQKDLEKKHPEDTVDIAIEMEFV